MPEVGGLQDAQAAGDDLERVDAPAVEPRPVDAECVDHDVADHQDREDRVRGPHVSVRVIDRAAPGAQGSAERGAHVVAGHSVPFSRC